MKSPITRTVVKSKSRRSTLCLFTAAFLVAIAGEARAQDANPNPVEDGVTAQSVRALRTPMLVVHETWSPVPETKSALQPTSKSQRDKKNPGAKQATLAKAGTSSSVEPAPPAGGEPGAPIVLGNGRVDSRLLLDTTGNPAYDALAQQAGGRYGVDPNLIIAVMRQESGFNPRAVSYKGASGLMQLMPATARRFGATNIFDPSQNVDAGARYLRFLLDTFNDDVNLVLAGYNAGENAVINSGYRVPRYRETQNYVRNISARYGSKTHLGSRQIAASGPVAPEAVSFTSGRLSNNY
jgi:transglycosylase-like protein with SLT domain